MISSQQSAALKALGRIERFKSDLDLVGSTLAELPHWLPAAALKKQSDEAVRMIEGIAERFERKLVVTIIGPCGAGKSTLLNALAGIDELSPTGHRRPTTGQIIIFSGNPEDAGQLAAKIGPDAVEAISSPAAARLEHVLIIDTPDTDSMAYPKHAPLVRDAIARSDMLICVFDSENPKRKDHVDFLAPFIRKFNGESLVAVINKCDRQDERELKDRIVPDFSNFIKAAWQTPVDRLLCISARRHLQDPRWDPAAGPRHGFDQFEDLQKLIFDRINRGDYVVERRLENSRSLRDFVYAEVARELSKCRDSLKAAREEISAAEKNSLLGAVAAMKNKDSQQILGVNLMIYQKLAQRWVGPMGWMIAIWARLLIFGTGMAALFRFGRPVRQIMGMISAWRHLKESRSALDDTTGDERVGSGLRSYRLSTMQSWPDIAESLIAGGFDGSVRNAAVALPARDPFSEQLAGIWSEALEAELERVSRGLSGWLLQLVFNLPALGIIGYTGWITVQRFFLGSYLTVDFFLHALLSIGIILLLSFFIYQACVRIAARTERVTGRAFEKMKRQTDQLAAIPDNPVRLQLETLMELDAIVAARKEQSA